MGRGAYVRVHNQRSYPITLNTHDAVRMKISGDSGSDPHYFNKLVIQPGQWLPDSKIGQYFEANAEVGQSSWWMGWSTPTENGVWMAVKFNNNEGWTVASGGNNGTAAVSVDEERRQSKLYRRAGGPVNLVGASRLKGDSSPNTALGLYGRAAPGDYSPEAQTVTRTCPLAHAARHVMKALPRSVVISRTRRRASMHLLCFPPTVS